MVSRNRAGNRETTVRSCEGLPYRYPSNPRGWWAVDFSGASRSCGARGDETDTPQRVHSVSGFGEGRRKDPSTRMLLVALVAPARDDERFWAALREQD